MLPQIAPLLSNFYGILIVNKLSKGIFMENCIGDKFGEWKLLEYKGRDLRSEQIYLCQCKCGLLKEHRLSTLKSGKSTQCKSCRMKKHNYREDKTGKQFGAWFVLEKFKNIERNEWQYKCQCKCGTIKNMAAHKLKNGLKGCPHCRVKMHGMSYTDTFRIWTGILRRCLNSNFKGFKYYGGRGIKVCESWFKFENFLADMGERPSKKLSIDRVNNDGDYEPNNCRWATSKEQYMNRRVILNNNKEK